MSSVALSGGAQINGNAAPHGDAGGVFISALPGLTASADVVFSGNSASTFALNVTVADLALHRRISSPIRSRFRFNTPTTITMSTIKTTISPRLW